MRIDTVNTNRTPKPAEKFQPKVPSDVADLGSSLKHDVLTVARGGVGVVGSVVGGVMGALPGVGYGLQRGMGERSSSEFYETGDAGTAWPLSYAVGPAAVAGIGALVLTGDRFLTLAAGVAAGAVGLGLQKAFRSLGRHTLRLPYDSNTFPVNLTYNADKLMARKVTNPFNGLKHGVREGAYLGKLALQDLLVPSLRPDQNTKYRVDKPEVYDFNHQSLWNKLGKKAGELNAAMTPKLEAAQAVLVRCPVWPVGPGTDANPDKLADRVTAGTVDPQSIRTQAKIRYCTQAALGLTGAFIAPLAIGAFAGGSGSAVMAGAGVAGVTGGLTLYSSRNRNNDSFDNGMLSTFGAGGGGAVGALMTMIGHACGPTAVAVAGVAGAGLVAYSLNADKKKFTDGTFCPR